MAELKSEFSYSLRYNSVESNHGLYYNAQSGGQNEHVKAPKPKGLGLCFVDNSGFLKESTVLRCLHRGTTSSPQKEVIMHVAQVVKHIAEPHILRMFAYLIFLRSARAFLFSLSFFHKSPQFTLLTPS